MVWDGYKSFETTPYCHHSSYLTLAKQRIGEDKLLSLFGVKKEIKRGQLCEFWNEGKDYTVIGKFYGYLDNRFSDRVGSYYDYCKPLTKEEIQEYLDLAED